MYAVYLILLGLAILSNSILIYILYNRSQRSPAIVSFIVFLFFANIWITPKFLTNALDAQGTTFEFFSRIAAIGYVFAPVSLLTFSLFYSMNFNIFKKMFFWISILVPSLTFLYLSWTSELVGVHSFETATKYSWGYETPAGPYFHYFVAWFVGLMAVSLYALNRHYHGLQDEIKKRQTYFVILSIIGPISVGTMTNGVLPFFNIFIFPSGLVLGNIMSVIVAYAIYKYRLFIVSPENVLSSIQHAIIAIDNNGLIIQMNPSAERLLNVKEGKVIGTDLQDILYVSNKNKKINHLMKLVRSVLSKGNSKTFESYSIMNTKRHVYPFTISITPIYLHKEIVGANIFLRDTKLEHDKEKQKEDYFSMLSHELKTPITSLKMYSYLLQKNINGHKSNYQLVSKMDRQITRIERLVQDFYELSTVQSGKLRVEKEYFVLDDFIREICETMKMTHKNRRIAVEGNTGTLVYADKDKIEQVIINFINNAMKYSPPVRKITVLLKSNTQYVTVGVRDYGMGIPAEYHKKIFERFYQVKHKTRKESGLGVGLYIASNIVKYHDGKIWVESKVGKGSTFYFSLPVNRRTGGKRHATISSDLDISYD